MPADFPLPDRLKPSLGRRLRRRLAELREAAAARLPLRVAGMEITVSGAVEFLARAGYAARGFIYVSMGLIALRAAAGLRHSATDGLGAILTLAEWPLGFVWLALIAAALLGFAVWRAAQVVLDIDRQGSRPRAIASRLGQAISGLVYGALALSVFEVLDAVIDRGDAHEVHEARERAAEILGWHGGAVVLIGAGLFVLGCGVGNIVQAVLTDFGKRLDCGPTRQWWARWCGRVGYAARGFAFLPLGVFMIEAGFDLDASQARDFGEALQSLESQPFGSLVLGMTAAGLVAFGLFALVEAAYRRIHPIRPAARRRG